MMSVSVDMIKPSHGSTGKVRTSSPREFVGMLPRDPVGFLQLFQLDRQAIEGDIDASRNESGNAQHCQEQEVRGCTSR